MPFRYCSDLDRSLDRMTLRMIHSQKLAHECKDKALIEPKIYPRLYGNLLVQNIHGSILGQKLQLTDRVFVSVSKPKKSDLILISILTFECCQFFFILTYAELNPPPPGQPLPQTSSPT